MAEILGQLENEGEGGLRFQPGVVSAVGRPFSITRWVRQRVERELNFEVAAHLGHELATARMSLWPGREPSLSDLSDTDQRLVAALRRPRTLSELTALTRAPRFRLFGFLHFARAVGALLVLGAKNPGLREKIQAG